MQIKNNTRYEIFTDNGFVDFSRISKSTTTLRRCMIGGVETYVSDKHLFYVNGVATPVQQLPEQCTVDGAGGSRVSFVKTTDTLVEAAYDLVGVATPDSHYVLSSGAKTHNCDEFAFVRDSTAEEFWTSIAPTLATGGSCIIASTPNGDSNLFAQLWRGAQAGVNGFFPIEVKWNEPPGRDEKFKKEEMGKLGKIRWLQEYECEMLSTDPLLFDSLVLTNLTAVTDKITPIGTAGDIVFYEQPQPKASYLIGVDPATGSGNDFATIQVFSFPAMEQVAEWRSNTVSSVILYHTLKKILLLFEKNESTVYFSVENNGVGEALIALYTADEHPPSADFVSEDGQKRQGMTTTGRSKIQACLSFKDMIERGAMTIRSSNLLKEMKNYARKAGSYAAKRGATDDLIAACLIVVRLVTEISSYDDDAYNKLYAGAHHVEAEDIDYDDSDYGVDFVM